MKKSKNGQKKKNTLLSYFSKVEDSSKKESLSSIIEKTTPQFARSSTITSTHYASKTSTTNSTIGNTPPRSFQQRNTSSSVINLCDDDDDDLMILTPPEHDSSMPSSQTSLFSSSSQNSSGKIINTSKFNKKGWSAKVVEYGPERSSQDVVLSQETQPVQRFEKVRLHKPRIESKVNYEWLGDKDVKPFSSKTPAMSRSVGPTRPVIVTGYDNSSSQEYPTKRRFDRSHSSTSMQDANLLWPSVEKKQKIKQEKSSETKFWTKTKARGGRYTAEESLAIGKLANQAQFNMPMESEYTPELSDEQKRVFDMVVNENQSLFFTGSAGTGKSVLLRAIISTLRERYGSRVAITASTGIAACNIGGCTLHR